MLYLFVSCVPVPTPVVIASAESQGPKAYLLLPLAFMHEIVLLIHA